jgi:FHA domain
MIVFVSSVEVEELLLALKIAFLVLLYLFIWRIVRSASRDVRMPQESFILAPEGGDGERRGVRRKLAKGRLVVLSSPALEQHEEHVLNSASVTIGRGVQNDIALAADEFSSAEHARFEPRQDGVWLEDVGSTNGTFVNGVRIRQPRKLSPGDVIRIGETDLRFER